MLDLGGSLRQARAGLAFPALGGVMIATILTFITAAQPVLSDTYEDYSQATIGDISSETALSAPDGTANTRTIVGIQEDVLCYVNPGTWVDLDCNMTTQQIEQDTIGTYLWMCSGDAEAFPTAGQYFTTLHAGGSESQVTLSLIISDSAQRYADNEVLRYKYFYVVPPASVAYTKIDDFHPWDEYVDGTPQLGAGTSYSVTVYPRNVSFYFALFCEDFGEGVANITWPDGSPWIPLTGVTQPASPDTMNIMNDFQTEGLHPATKLFDGENWVSKVVSFSIDLCYLNSDSEWQSFATTTAVRRFDATTLETTVGVGVPAVYGNPQGPFQEGEE